MIRLQILCLSLVLAACSSTPSVDTKPQADFARAALFLPESLKNKVHNVTLHPQWLNNSGDFWFERYTPQKGQEFVLVTQAQPSALFDKQRLAQALSLNGGIDWLDKPLHKVTFDANQLRFTYAEQQYTCLLETTAYTCEQQAPQPEPKHAYLSPDKQHFVKLENYNLHLCQSAQAKCKQITFDGTHHSPYAIKHPYPETLLEDRDFAQAEHLQVLWSSDSRYAITYKLFRQGVTKLTLTDSTADLDFTVNTVEYYYPQAGDENLPMAQLFLLDTVTQEGQLLDAPKVMQTYYGGALWGEWQNGAFYYHDRRRGNQTYHLGKVLPEEGRAISLITETDDQFIDPWVQTFTPLTDSERLVWTSQRTGYQHLYLYNTSTGELINPITQGDYTVRSIKGIDEQREVLYFEASGKTPNIDPYLRQLYRVNLDGTNLTLLTPEPYEHSTSVAPDFTYFVDNISDARTPTESWLRDTQTGDKVVKLDQADITELTALGWQAPEPFEVLADDGQTPLYGLLYKPSNFDPNKRYAIINDTYTGPHNFFTPKSFLTYNNQRPALAELGFIVIKMDGRGTNKRGKAFHRHSYKNLAAGTDDHVWAIKQLAKRHSYMDISRVGIFGFSAGGYDTMQAMLRHNDFFTVGVSASGNHDFQVDKTGWNEIWMGWPVTAHWQEQSNYTDVDRLKGKLLLAHGELDSNVHPSATLRLVDKLIAADKDFDLLMMPKMGHYLDRSPYFVKRRWQFFIDHLSEK